MWKLKATYQLNENGSFFQEHVTSDKTDLIDASTDVVSRVRKASPTAINITVELIK
jgi:phenylpyruvate tautomerase PptA (4-oxalocrotonate tautomerase family)